MVRGAGGRHADQLPHRQRRLRERLRRPGASRAHGSGGHVRDGVGAACSSTNGVQIVDLLTVGRAAALPRPEVRVGRERHRLHPVHPRSGRLRVRRVGDADATGPSSTACRASSSTAGVRLLLLRGARASAAARRRDRRPTTSCSRPTTRIRSACSATCGRRSTPTLDGQPPEMRRKVLWDNAAALYKVEANDREEAPPAVSGLA